MILKRIQIMLQSLLNESPSFPPTSLYNETWFIRLVLDWFSTHDVPNHPLTFPENARWFSEALLPSAFQARHHGDKLAESRTHADGTVGHFVIGSKGKVDLQLLPNAKHFMVLEAKMFSKLSSGVTHAKYFDQAARNVACISEVLRCSGNRPETFDTLGFYILAPDSQIKDGIFQKEMNPSSIIAKVGKRVNEYGGEKDAWLAEWFQPTMDNIDIQCLSWEEVISTIQSIDSSMGTELDKFYSNCLKFNKPSNFNS